MYHRSETSLASRLHYCLPVRVVFAFQKQDFEHAFVVFDMTENARGNNSRVVDNEQIALLQKGRQVVKMFVLHRIGGTIVDEKSRMVARIDRRLSNQLFGQIVIEIVRRKSGCVFVVFLHNQCFIR